MDKDLAYEAHTYDLGEWLTGPWVQELIESEDGDHYQVTHKDTGQILATLPDWAGSIALWMCVARDAMPALLADADAHTVQVLHEAARLMEFTGRNDDAVNFLDQLAARAGRKE